MNDIRDCYLRLARQLREQQHVSKGEAYWLGRLSSSALSTALACIALSLDRSAAQQKEQVERGFTYLCSTQNSDGSWGDTDNSPGNTSTSLLVYAAFKIRTHLSVGENQSLEQLENWLVREVGGLDAVQIVQHITSKYGTDKTFSVPILMTLAIAKCIDWRSVPQLPFELAAFPQSLYAALRLPVVSYALPALIAIGIARHAQVRSCCSPLYFIRRSLRRRCLKKLTAIQPVNGGFLEATPLTAFVGMALFQAFSAKGRVYKKSIQFLQESQREDGSWPIDTNLSTWVTSLAVHASKRPLPHSQQVQRFYLQQQFKTVHPFTGAAPGAWAWTNLPGAVPDADDTSGAILALCKCDKPAAKAIEAGVRWLLQLQNTNGGMPTFCRGWGTLPFDQSCVDISAHALRAFKRARDYCSEQTCMLIDQRCARLLQYIISQQQADGSFLPLWFGNQQVPGQSNPVLGTARVLLALSHVHKIRHSVEQRAMQFLLQAQNEDGSWGAAAQIPGSVEETALVVEALSSLDDLSETGRAAVDRGAAYLCAAWKKPVLAQPIGLYFASLWYYEDLYPLTMSVAALRVYLERYDHVGH